jgi:purine-nucleoside phosphorylase
MSTVWEARTAAALGMEVAGISCVANRAAGLSAFPLSHTEVLSMVQAAASRMTRLIAEIVNLLPR